MAVDMAFLSRVDSPRFCERLFAVLPDVVFCIKDDQRRYRAANRAFAERLGLQSATRLLGLQAEDFFPAELAAAYRRQDETVLRRGRSIVDELELVTNRDGTTGWYLATKVPLHDSTGRIIGLASVSRDLRSPEAGEAEIAGVARVVEHVRDHLDESLRTDELARVAGLSPGQLDRRIRRVFGVTAARFVRKVRIGRAAELLERSLLPIAEIALACGYADQSALTRQFHATVGMPPAAFRERSTRKLPPP